MKILIHLLVLTFSFALIACSNSVKENNQDPESNSEQEPAQGMANITVSIPALQQRTQTRSGNYRSIDQSQVPAEIDSVVIDVLNNQGKILDSGDILASGGELGLTIIAGSNYTLRGRAFAANEVLFLGTTFIARIAGGENQRLSLSLLEQVSLSLSPLADQNVGGSSVSVGANLSGLTNQSLVWYVNDVEGGNATIGTINSVGIYTPPAALPINTSIEIKAEPLAAPSFAATINFNLIPPGNVAPVADAGVDQTVSAGITVLLDASASDDADGSLVSYSWSFVSGDSNPVLSNANTSLASFTAPSIQFGGSTTYRLTVTDNDGAQSLDEVTINFSASDQAIVASAGLGQTVTEGDTVTLDATASHDPDNAIASYLWQQTSGTSVSLSSTSSASPSFTAPDVTSDEDLVFRVTVTNDVGLNDSATVTIRVNDMVLVSSNVYFAAASDGFTHTLWTSDGTELGTQQLNSVQVQNSEFSFSKQVGDYLYFSGNDGINGNELWRSNGTVAGTQMLPVADESEYSSGASASANPNNYIALGDRLLFGANTSQVGGISFPEFLSVDATSADISSTDFTVVHDDRPSAGFGRNNNALATYSGYAYFIDADYTPPGTYSLYRSNGVNTAELVLDTLGSAHAHDFTVFDGQLYFVSGSTSNQLWRTDGATTTLFKTFSGRVGYSFSSDATFMPFSGGTLVEGGRLYFVADDGDGRELWSSNGISANAPDTQLILDLDSNAASSSFPFAFRSVNGNVVFMSQNGDASTDGLWVTDGTAGGTSRLAAISVGDDVGFYSGHTDSEPLVINVEGTEQLFFVGNDGTNGAELWVSDGTVGGTSMVSDLRTGALGSEPGVLRDGGGFLIFSAQDNDDRAKLWRSDGTASGTNLVLDICPTDCFENSAFFSFGG